MAEPMGSVDELKRSLADLIEESQALRTDVKSADKTRAQENEVRRKENRINLALIGMLAIFVLMVLGVAWQNNQIASSTADTNRRIADCTTAGGQCYEDGQRRTAVIVGDITRASVYVIECTRLRPGESGPAYDAFLEQCVAEKLEAARRAGK